MAEWNGGILTNKGRALAAKVESGALKLTLTKMKVGDGVADNIEEMTDLASPQQIINISTIVTADDGTCDVSGVLTNEELEKGFYIRELGLYAQDTEEEILYAVATAGKADYLQAKGGAAVEVLDMHMKIAISSESEINLNTNLTGIATVEDIATHNKAADAHMLAESTIDDDLEPENDTNKIRALLSQLANRIKAITGNDDWKGDPFTNLATMAAFITNLESAGDVKWDGKKFTNRKMGVSGLIDQNGYIAFGKNFGGLIIQWVYVSNKTNASYRTISFPIAFPNGVFICVANFCGYSNDDTNACIIWNDGETTGSTVQFLINGNTNSSPNCIAIGH